MDQIFYCKKKLKGFTLIEMIITAGIFFLVLSSMLSLTLKSYRFYTIILNREKTWQNLEIMRFNIERMAKLSSSAFINSNNHGVRFYQKGQPVEVYFKNNFLWVKRGGKVSKFPSSKTPLEQVDFVLEQGYLTCRLKAEKMSQYFEVKMP